MESDCYGIMSYIQFDKQRMEQELFNLYPFLQNFGQSLPNEKKLYQNMFLNQSFSILNEDHENQSRDTYDSQKQNIKQQKLMDSLSNEESDGESFSSSNPKKRKKKISKKNKEQESQGYPTKNFLPNAKPPHFDFLYEKLGEDYVKSFPGVQEIFQKNGISMKDYEFLYKIKEFQEAFKCFFQTKVLYRDLMLSRSTMKSKKIHQRKLKVFEQAFYSKNFTRIN